MCISEKKKQQHKERREGERENREMLKTSFALCFHFLSSSSRFSLSCTAMQCIVINFARSFSFFLTCNFSFSIFSDFTAKMTGTKDNNAMLVKGLKGKKLTLQAIWPLVGLRKKRKLLLKGFFFHPHIIMCSMCRYFLLAFLHFCFPFSTTKTRGMNSFNPLFTSLFASDLHKNEF